MKLDHNNLEEFQDPQNYDIQDPSDTGLDFYAALAQETGSPILELGCGTGRITIPLAKKGFSLTGIDPAIQMLAHAKRKAKQLPIDWIAADARSFHLQKKFKLIFLTGNTFQLFLTPKDQKSMLTCAHHHLHDNGLFAFETRNPRWPPKHKETEPIENKVGKPLFTFLETDLQERVRGTYIDINGNKIRVTKTQQYDPETQILQWTTYRRWHVDINEQTRASHIAVRFTFPQELTALLTSNGYETIRQYSDWDLTPLTADSPSIIVVCRKRT